MRTESVRKIVNKTKRNMDLYKNLREESIVLPITEWKRIRGREWNDQISRMSRRNAIKGSNRSQDKIRMKHRFII